MRDDVIARRALLALAAGVILAGGLGGAAEARSARKSGLHRHAPRHRRMPMHVPKPLHTVAVDPGHGGPDPGAISPHHVYEKNITLPVARELARQLEASGRYRAVLTRHGDTFVPLRKRVERARAKHADLLLSLHADMLPDATVRGLSVYTLSEEASDHEAAALAARENKDDFVSGVHLSRQPRVIGAILLDLAQRQTNNASQMLAHAIVEDMGHAVPLLDTPHRSAGFAVLTAPDMPSALVELGCLSNPDDERLLQQHAYQRRIATALMRSIDDFFAARLTT
ncbi:MAG TPA: N-acetylmuramoyl-L-alanine amidase [Stellaceae bacterium]|jgi:N-acetylmuramoyl-L-alanine amidase|nr:N-acetylmuramoyl-L-alanine amidase [Stellaceae bacterium]